MDSTAELFALAGLDESRGTLFASRRLSLPDLRRAFRLTNAAPRRLPRRGAHPVQHNPCRTGASQTGPDLRQNFVHERPSCVTFAVINRLKALRAPGESYSDVILVLAATY